MSQPYPAQGKRALLCFNAFTQRPFLRVDDGESFIDCDIRHRDIEVVITDSDAVIHPGENPYIDYSPQTLGKPL